MIRYLLSIGLLATIMSLSAQDCQEDIYADFIAKGQELVTNGDYIKAFEYYNSAKDYCPERAAAVDELVTQLITQIAADQERTEAALAQAEKLVDAFYFYDRKFALAYGEKGFRIVFYFIDKNGDEVERLGQWEKAEQFDYSGYAKVQQAGDDFLLDTLGNRYSVAYSLAALDGEKTALDLRGVKLDAFPRRILDYSQLEILLLGDYNNRIDIILPEDIDQLVRLKHLRLRYCRLTQLPASIGQLTQSNRLDLWGNQLTQLPAGIGQLTQLEELTLRENQLTQLPASIGQLTQLEELDLWGNQLTQLPASIGQLTQLNVLSLGENQLTQLPESIGQLIQLNALDIISNQLTQLPTSIGQLTQLEELYLEGNQLTQLPENIGQLTQLEKLDLERNQLTQLPASIGQLTQLEELYLEGNQLTDLPPTMNNLWQLQWLDLRGNPNLPPEIISRLRAQLLGTIMRYE
ncbi:MAG: leucine-rich repeat domain-containing protein [Bacteroidota bacterium]